MRSVAVVVIFVVAEYCVSVSFIHDHDAVEQLPTDAAHEAFRDRIGPRRPNRRSNDCYADGGEHGVESGGELRVAVAYEEPEPSAGVVEIHGEVAGQLGEPRAGRVGGDAEDVHAAVGVLDHEERIQAAQGDSVEVKQVAGHDPVRLGPYSAHEGPARRGEGSMPDLRRIFHTVEAPIW